MYENIAVSLTPRFGLKLAGDGVSVQKIYNLSGPDFISVTQAGSWLPQWNSATDSVRVQVNSSVAGYLQSASNITVQIGNSYVVSCVGKDTDPTDTVGLTLGAVIGNLPMAYCRIQKHRHRTRHIATEHAIARIRVPAVPAARSVPLKLRTSIISRLPHFSMSARAL